MNILIVGSEGSMGKRYQAILKYLGHNPVCADLGTSNNELIDKAMGSGGVIIATPTHTHTDIIRLVAPTRKPILCEKPVCKDPEELRGVLELVQTFGTPFAMMMQYKELAHRDTIGPSMYNYFRHGNDGLIWDCFQVIALARGTVNLGEDSPVWACKINGKTLNLSHMDSAYISYVQKWLKNPDFHDHTEIQRMHEKVAAAERMNKYGQLYDGSNRHSGTVNL
jgi:hypothetical protein